MTKITITGRLTAAPELRFTPGGAPVANFTVAEDRGHFDKATNAWTKDGTSFHRVQAWRHLAESCADKLDKGVLVVVVGDLAERQYETRDGDKRNAWEVTADEVGLLLSKFAPKDTAASGAAQRPAARPAAAGSDPWASKPDDPPFMWQAPVLDLDGRASGWAWGRAAS